MFARVEKLRVVELFAKEPTLHQDLMTTVYACPDTVSVGDSFDGQNFTVYAPSAAEVAATRAAQITARLDRIDTESVRPLRAIYNGTATTSDTDKLLSLETEAGALRADLASL